MKLDIILRGDNMNLLRLTIAAYLALMLAGCACVGVKTDKVAIGYCRCGDQKIKIGDFQQESDGDMPTGLGTIIDAVLGM
jgi:hypothetical protein